MDHRCPFAHPPFFCWRGVRDATQSISPWWSSRLVVVSLGCFLLDKIQNNRTEKKTLRSTWGYVRSHFRRLSDLTEEWLCKENVCLFTLREETKDSEIFVPFCCSKRVVWSLVHFHRTCKASQSLGETSVPISCSVVESLSEEVADVPGKHITKQIKYMVK